LPQHYHTHTCSSPNSGAQQCMHMHTSAHGNPHTHTHACTHTYSHTHLQTHAHTHTLTHTHLHTRTPTHPHTQVYLLLQRVRWLHVAAPLASTHCQPCPTHPSSAPPLCVISCVCVCVCVCVSLCLFREPACMRLSKLVYFLQTTTHPLRRSRKARLATTACITRTLFTDKGNTCTHACANTHTYTHKHTNSDLHTRMQTHTTNLPAAPLSSASSSHVLSSFAHKLDKLAHA
jgi:hypothetical protein